MTKIIFGLAVIVLIVGCGPREAGKETGAMHDAFDLKVVPGNNKLTLSWNPVRSALISGYNIYISDAPTIGNGSDGLPPSTLKPFNSAPFPGDTDPDDEQEVFVAEGLANGLRHFVSVRVVYPDGSLSEPSTEIPVVCGPRGEIELSIRYRSDHDGYSFDDDSYVRADATTNDLYYYAKDGIDYLASPDRLDGFLKSNKLAVLPFDGGFDVISKEAMAAEIVPTEDRVVISKGDWVLLRASTGRHALLNVIGFSGRNEERSVQLFFSYSTLSDGGLFF